MSSSRREFLRGSGSLLLIFAMPEGSQAQYVSPNPGQDLQTDSLRAVDNWIRIDASGSVLISVGKVEFGQLGQLS